MKINYHREGVTIEYSYCKSIYGLKDLYNSMRGLGGQTRTRISN